ncbi:uncharacterized protein TNCV_4955051 [Trichonephila clavipes]|nr:uncharacterized protein TNCV_4955051 [Trichonephila clavipes]
MKRVRFLVRLKTRRVERPDVRNLSRLKVMPLKKVIESVEEGERKVDVAKAFEIPLSSLSTILKNKEKIFSASSSKVRKRVSKGNFPRLEQCLVSWMRQCRGQNIPTGGVACLVTSSSPVPLKTLRVGQRCTLNLSKAETSSRGVV